MDDQTVTKEKESRTRLGELLVKVIRRFPLALIFLLILPFQIDNFEQPYSSYIDFSKLSYAYIAMAGAIWFVVAELFAESRSWSLKKRYGIAVSLFALICWLITNKVGLTNASVQILVFTFILALGFAPWLFKPEDNLSFWYFNYHQVVPLIWALLGLLVLLPVLFAHFGPVSDTGGPTLPGIVPYFFPFAGIWLLFKIPAKLSYCQDEVLVSPRIQMLIIDIFLQFFIWLP
jgi:hypothetical protein